MNKTLIRFVAFLLIPALVAEPALSTPWHWPAPIHSHWPGIFEEQAIPAADTQFRQLRPPLSPAILREARLEVKIASSRQKFKFRRSAPENLAELVEKHHGSSVKISKELHASRDTVRRWLKSAGQKRHASMLRRSGQLETITPEEHSPALWLWDLLEALNKVPRIYKNWSMTPEELHASAQQTLDDLNRIFRWLGPPGAALDPVEFWDIVHDVMLEAFQKHRRKYPVLGTLWSNMADHMGSTARLDVIWRIAEAYNLAPTHLFLIYSLLRQDRDTPRVHNVQNWLVWIENKNPAPVQSLRDELEMSPRFVRVRSLTNRAERRLQDPAPDPETGLIQKDLISKVTQKLTPQEWNVLMGLQIGGSTLEEIGERYHVTRERVRQIEAQAIRKGRRAALRLEGPFKRRMAARPTYEESSMPSLTPQNPVVYPELPAGETFEDPAKDLSAGDLIAWQRWGEGSPVEIGVVTAVETTEGDWPRVHVHRPTRIGTPERIFYFDEFVEARRLGNAGIVFLKTAGVIDLLRLGLRWVDCEYILSVRRTGGFDNPQVRQIPRISFLLQSLQDKNLIVTDPQERRSVRERLQTARRDQLVSWVGDERRADTVLRERSRLNEQRDFFTDLSGFQRDQLIDLYEKLRDARVNAVASRHSGPALTPVSPPIDVERAIVLPGFMQHPSVNQSPWETHQTGRRAWPSQKTTIKTWFDSQARIEIKDEPNIEGNNWKVIAVRHPTKYRLLNAGVRIGLIPFGNGRWDLYIQYCTLRPNGKAKNEEVRLKNAPPDALKTVYWAHRTLTVVWSNEAKARFAAEALHSKQVDEAVWDWRTREGDIGIRIISESERRKLKDGDALSFANLTRMNPFQEPVLALATTPKVAVGRSESLEDFIKTFQPHPEWPDVLRIRDEVSKSLLQMLQRDLEPSEIPMLVSSFALAFLKAYPGWFLTSNLIVDILGLPTSFQAVVKATLDLLVVQKLIRRSSYSWSGDRVRYFAKEGFQDKPSPSAATKPTPSRRDYVHVLNQYAQPMTMSMIRWILRDERKIADDVYQNLQSLRHAGIVIREGEAPHYRYGLHNQLLRAA